MTYNVFSGTLNPTQSIKHCRQKRTEPQPHLTCTANLVKFGRCVCEICERIDRHTDTLIAILRTPIGAKQRAL